MHHTANVMAIAIPISAWLASLVGVLQPVAALVLTLLGIAYYVRLFYRDWRDEAGGR